MRGYRVSFINVGRNRECWERVFPAPLDADAVAVEAGRVLISRGPEVTMDLMRGTGAVFAGAHRVGTLRIVPCLMGDA